MAQATLGRQIIMKEYKRIHVSYSNSKQSFTIKFVIYYQLGHSMPAKQILRSEAILEKYGTALAGKTSM